MLQSRGTEAIVALEDRAPDVLFSTLPGTDIHLWPLFRMLLAQAIEELDLNAIPVRTSVSRLQLVSQVARGLLHHPFSPAKIASDQAVLYFVNGTTYQQTPTGRRNWLVDAFAETYPDQSVILQNTPVSRSRRSAFYPTFTRTYNSDGLSSRVELAAKFSPLSDANRNFASMIVHEVAAELNYPIAPGHLDAIIRGLSHRLVRIHQASKNYEKILTRVHPRIAIIEDASYGSHSSLIKMLKERGVLVVEPQHGWIGPSHAAYNFGSSMSTPLLAQYLPDVLLTFGEFWSESIRHPANVIAIGKPHLETSVAQSFEHDRSRKEVLIASSVYDTPRVIHYVLALRDALPDGWKVRLRPHPSERPFVQEIFSDLVDQRGVEFDETTDVYESLSTARAVFGFASTVLYEALAFDCDVFVLDSALAELYVPASIFGARITDTAAIERAAHDLVHATESNTVSHDQVAAMWKPHARENFRRFVGEVLDSPSPAN